jgi:hypothetical protein
MPLQLVVVAVLEALTAVAVVVSLGVGLLQHQVALLAQVVLPMHQVTTRVMEMLLQVAAA